MWGRSQHPPGDALERKSKALCLAPATGHAAHSALGGLGVEGDWSPAPAEAKYSGQRLGEVRHSCDALMKNHPSRRFIQEINIPLQSFRKGGGWDSARGWRRRRRSFPWTADYLSCLPVIEIRAIGLPDLQEAFIEFWGICPVSCANENLKSVPRV